MVSQITNITLLLVAILSLLNCSRPNSVKFSNWLKYLSRQIRKTRKKDDHIRSAVVIRKFERCTKNHISNFVQAVFASPKKLFVNKSIGAWFSALCVLGPFFYLMLLSDNHGSLVFKTSVFVLVCMLIFGSFIFFVISANFPQKSLVIDGVEYVTISERKFLFYLFVPFVTMIGFRFAFLYDEKGKRIPSLRFVVSHVAISMTMFSVAIVVALHKSMVNVLDLPAYIFYPVFMIVGPIFFLIIGIFLVAAVTLPTMFKGKTPFDGKKLANGAMFLSLSTTISFVLYYSSQFEDPRIFRSLSAYPVYINVVADMYVIFLFSRLTHLIVITRRKSNKFVKLILREYLFFVIRTIIASIIATYFAFWFTDMPLNVIQAGRLFIGLNPFEDASYFGAIFWLTHTALLPLFVILTIPILFMIYRLFLIFNNRILVGVLRHGNPVVYITASLTLFVAVLRIGTGFD